MKKKVTLEADLDPPGTRHTRPGAKAAASAMENAKAALKGKGGTKPTATRAGEPSRPGAAAAARAVEMTKAARNRSK